MSLRYIVYIEYGVLAGGGMTPTEESNRCDASRASSGARWQLSVLIMRLFGQITVVLSLQHVPTSSHMEQWCTTLHPHHQDVLYLCRITC